MGFQFSWEADQLSILAAPHLCTAENIIPVVREILERSQSEAAEESFSMSDHIAKILASSLVVATE